MMRFLRSIIPLFCLQKPPKVEEAEKLMMEVYKQVYKKYFREKHAIPDGNLIEIRYEDFIQQPLKHIQRMYAELQLDGFKESEQSFKDYLASQIHVKRHTYDITEEVKEKIYKEWKFAFDEFGYER
jgi:hypothetical protein